MNNNITKDVPILVFIFENTPKIVNKCDLPLTGISVVDKIITNLGVFEVTDHIKVLEMARNTSKDDIIKNTEAEVFF